MSSSREAHKSKAKMCEQVERYEDMVKEMKELIEGSGKTDEPLDEEERNFLSVAYKNVVGSRRSAWRTISAKLEKETNDNQRRVAEDMKKRVEKELNDLCKDVLKLINDHLLPNHENFQAKIFFLKMRGDYNRYMIEICGDNPREDLVKRAESAYEDAFGIAKDKLPPISPIRLGLALNYSVFFYEIKNDPDRACDLARTEFEEAMSGIEDMQDKEYAKDSTLIMQLLRDNLTLWQSEREEDDNDD